MAGTNVYNIMGPAGKKMQVPQKTWQAIPPNAQRAAQSAYQKGGMGPMKEAVSGQPWANDLTQAANAATGAAQNKPGMRPPSTASPEISAAQAVGASPAPTPRLSTTLPKAAGFDPYSYGQGGRGGYSFDEWKQLQHWINQQDPAIAQQIYSGLSGVKGAQGLKFDYLLNQIRRFVPQGAPGPVPGPGQGGGSGGPPVVKGGGVQPDGGPGGGMGSVDGLPMGQEPPVYGGVPVQYGIPPSSGPIVGSAGGATVDPEIIKQALGITSNYGLPF